MTGERKINYEKREIREKALAGTVFEHAPFAPFASFVVELLFPGSVSLRDFHHTHALLPEIRVEVILLGENED